MRVFWSGHICSLASIRIRRMEAYTLFREDLTHSYLESLSFEIWIFVLKKYYRRTQAQVIGYELHEVNTWLKCDRLYTRKEPLWVESCPRTVTPI